MAEIKAAGFNMATGPCGPSYDVATNKRVLTAAATVGLKVMVLDDRVLQAASTGNMALLDAVIADYSSYPALGGYFLADEPSMSSFSQLGAVVSYLRAHDPNHPAYVNLLPNYASSGQLGTSDYPTYLDQFLSTARTSILSYDHYQRNPFFANLAAARTAAAAHAVPF